MEFYVIASGEHSDWKEMEESAQQFADVLLSGFYRIGYFEINSARNDKNHSLPIDALHERSGLSGSGFIWRENPEADAAIADQAMRIAILIRFVIVIAIADMKWECIWEDMAIRIGPHGAPIRQAMFRRCPRPRPRPACARRAPDCRPRARTAARRA